MSTEDPESEGRSLEQQLIAADSRSSDLLSKARDLRGEAEDLPIEHKRRLPEFTGQWTQENVENYLTELERVVRDPQVTQSEDRLNALGIPEEKINTIKREILQQYAEIDTLASEYEALHDTFEEYIEFLISDGLFVDWLRENGPVETKHRIKIDNESKYQNLTDLGHLPRGLKKTFFREVFLDERSVDPVQNLDGWIDTLESYDVDVEYEGDPARFIQNCETAVNRAQTLRNEYGYSERKLRKWVAEMGVVEAKDEFKTKIDNAGQKRDRLQKKLEEYCELLGKEVPNLDAIPKLEEEVSDLDDELREEIGVTGEQFLDFIRGRRDELPETEEKEQLLEALEKVRPLLRRRLERE